MFSRITSASIHTFISSSSTAGDRASAGSACHSSTAEAIGPEPRGGVAPPMAVRSFISVVRLTRQPSPGRPRISSPGTLTSVKYTSLNSAPPVIWRSGRTSTPGACMSTTNAVMPACLTALDRCGR